MDIGHILFTEKNHPIRQFDIRYVRTKSDFRKKELSHNWAAMLLR